MTIKARHMETVLATMDTISPDVDGKDFEELYERVFPVVARFVHKMNGTYDDARDIFQDACVVMFEKDSAEKQSYYLTREAYLVGIARHLWMQKYKLDKQTVNMSAQEATIEVPDDFYPPIDVVRMTSLLETAGRKCLDLLRGFYFSRQAEGHSENALHYASRHSVSVQKYKCLEKLRNFVKQKSMRYEDFME